LGTPYSLGKLIEWKQLYIGSTTPKDKMSPYSLGKLIEWKLHFVLPEGILIPQPNSLLVREIN
jgi:hypothetical protein